MNVLDMLVNAQGGASVAQLGSQFGLDQTQTQAALGALVPALAAGVQRNVVGGGGLENLIGALAGGGHRRYVEDVSSLAAPETTADGNAILSHILGSRDVSRQVASQAASQTGIGADVLKQMLPVVAAMMMGAMSQRSGSSAMGLGPQGSASTIASMLGPLLDQNRDGSLIDDVLGMANRFFKTGGPGRQG